MTTYTIFGIVEEYKDRTYSVNVDAESPEDAKKKAILEAPFPIIVAGVVKGKVAALDNSNADLTPIRGKGYVTKVATVRVDYRDFNVPFACPKCKADLLKPESLLQWDYWDYYWEGRVPRGVYKGDHGIAINHDKGARTGKGFETTIIAVVLQCNHCEHELWNGYKEKD